MKKIIFTLIAAVSLFSGCDDWLDVKPKTQEPASSMFDTYQGYQDALMGCYVKMKSRTLYGEHLTITTIEYLAQHWDISTAFVGNLVLEYSKKVKNYKYEDDEFKNNIQSIFDELYNIIVQANTIIEAIPLTSEKVIEDEHSRAVVEGEAYAIRAFCHFDILRLFGQVPSGTIPVRLPYTETISREAPPYYNYEDFTDKIANDLTRALQLLGEHDPLVKMNIEYIDDRDNVVDDFLRYRKLRFNYWAVKALQARFCLYTGKTAEAHAAAVEVINASSNEKGFVLDNASMKNDVTNKYYGSPTESLFLLNNHQIKDYITSMFYGPKSEYANLYMSPDKLKDPQMFETSVKESTDIRYQKLWTHDKKNMYGVVTPELNKYDQDETDKLRTSILMLYKQIMPMLRLSEVYLIAMEASEDLTEINSLYERFMISRNLTPKTFTSKDEVLETIYKEYRRELFGEGQMFFLYKRLNAEQMLWRKDKIKESDYIIPIPDTEVDPNN